MRLNNLKLYREINCGTNIQTQTCLTPKPMVFPLVTHVETSFKEGRQARHSNLERIWPGIPKVIVI